MHAEEGEAFGERLAVSDLHLLIFDVLPAEYATGPYDWYRKRPCYRLIRGMKQRLKVKRYR